VAGHDYEVRFRGEAGATVCAAFPEFEITAADGATVLRGRLPDQAALHGTLDRVLNLGLELTDVRVLDDSRD
jgi:hypothetical protein